MKRLLLRRATGDQRWTCVVQTDEGCIERGRRSRTGVFLEPDDLLEDRESAASDIPGPRNSRPASLCLFSLPGQNILARGRPIFGRRLRRRVSLQPLTRLAPKV